MPVRPVERHHELRAQPLAEWMHTDQVLELGHDLRVPTLLKVGVKPILECGDAQLLEPGDVRSGKRFVGEVLKRRSSPLAQSAPQDGASLRAARRMCAPALRQ